MSDLTPAQLLDPQVRARLREVCGKATYTVEENLIGSKHMLKRDGMPFAIEHSGPYSLRSLKELVQSRTALPAALDLIDTLAEVAHRASRFEKEALDSGLIDDLCGCSGASDDCPNPPHCDWCKLRHALAALSAGKDGGRIVERRPSEDRACADRCVRQ